MYPKQICSRNCFTHGPCALRGRVKARPLYRQLHIFTSAHTTTFDDCSWQASRLDGDHYRLLTNPYIWNLSRCRSQCSRQSQSSPSIDFGLGCYFYLEYRYEIRPRTISSWRKYKITRMSTTRWKQWSLSDLVKQTKWKAQKKWISPFNLESQKCPQNAL